MIAAQNHAAAARGIELVCLFYLVFMILPAVIFWPP